MTDARVDNRKDAVFGTLEETLSPTDDESSFEIIPYINDEEFSNIKFEGESILKKVFSNPRYDMIYSDAKIKPANDIIKIKVSGDTLNDVYSSSSDSSYNSCFDVNEAVHDNNKRQQIVTRQTEAFLSLMTLANESLENSVSSGKAVEIPPLQDVHRISSATMSFPPEDSFSFGICETKIKHRLSSENLAIHQIIEVPDMLTTNEELIFQKNLDSIPVRNENTKLIQKYSGRSTCMYKAVTGSLNFCKWVREKNILQSIMELFKISIQNVRSAVQMEVYSIKRSLSSYFITLTIVSEESNFSTIKGVFKNVFNDQVLTSEVQVSLDTIPTLPVGFLSALTAANSKIDHIRRHTYVNNSEPVISTSTFVFQAVPQRWQISTVLCLHDPTLHLTLHNFTVTTPIPNEYILAAERLTPLSYPHRERGFSVTIEQAINASSEQTKSIQEYLSDYKDSKAMESAALVLAGMYKKYTIGQT